MNASITPEERAAILALNSIFGFSPKKGEALLTNVEDLVQLFHTDRSELMRMGIREERILNQLTPQKFLWAQKELERLEALDSSFLTIRDPSYPSLLKECGDAPLGLYLKSHDVPENIFSPLHPAIAIVGTRDISPYGTETCIQLVRTLSQMRPKPLIVSGLALGVDITAHKTALENDLPTLAVMATGVDSIYPFSHGWTADRIVRTEGSGLLSDYPLQTRPQALNFIRRNRIMAGMCLATILIESKIRGGGLVTAKLASSYNREVYAVPGRIKDLRSQGCNWLIRRNIATALTDLDQISTDLGISLGCQLASPSEDLPGKVRKMYENMLNARELGTIIYIIKKIVQEIEIPQEALAAQCNIPFNDLLYLTGLLESDGFIQIDLLHNCSINKDFV